ncbi:electron transport complex subunit RsxB [Oligella ureolytica]
MRPANRQWSDKDEEAWHNYQARETRLTNKQTELERLATAAERTLNNASTKAKPILKWSC